MQDSEEERGSETGGVASSPVSSEDAGKGAGEETGALGGHDDPEDNEGGVGGDALEGPTKDSTSPPGGGSVDGPQPGGVPKEGRVDPDADTTTGAN